LKEENSAGVIICIKKSDGIHFLLLHYPTGHWDFVKGKIEYGETYRQTALRETREETGISDLEFVKGFEEKINYYFQFEGELIYKQVVFFLAKTKTDKVNVSYEHLDYTWLNYDEALEKLTYPNAKNILSKANTLLRNA